MDAMDEDVFVDELKGILEINGSQYDSKGAYGNTSPVPCETYGNTSPVSRDAYGKADTRLVSRDAKGHTDMNLLEGIIVILSYCLVTVTFPFSLLFCLQIAQEYQRAVIFRLGRVLSGGARGPGIYFLLPCTDEAKLVDLREITFDIPPQEILTKDSVTCAVDAVVYYKISDPVMSVVNVVNAFNSTQLLAQTFLRNLLGTMALAEILADRVEISENLKGSLAEATDAWGIKVDRVEIKDVRLPVQLQRAMAAEGEAIREAKAKVIAAAGELDASKALKEAADILYQSPSSLQLRYLQTLSTIAAEKNSTIIFPFPIELLSGMRWS